MLYHCMSVCFFFFSLPLMVHSGKLWLMQQKPSVVIGDSFYYNCLFCKLKLYLMGSEQKWQKLRLCWKKLQSLSMNLSKRTQIITGNWAHKMC